MKPIQGLPRVHIEVDGISLSQRELFTLAEVRVQGRLSLPTLCELVFTDPPGSLPADDIFTPGSRLRVNIRGQAAPLFVGQVTAVEFVYEPSGGRAMRVRGYDLLHALRKRQEVREHSNVTLVDLARAFTADLSIDVQADADSPMWRHLLQYRQSDFELLTELAERCGVFLNLKQDTLRIITLDGAGEIVPLKMGDTLLEAQIEINGDPAARNAAATGWNPSRIETYTGITYGARNGRSASAEVPPDNIGGTGWRNTTDALVQDGDHALGLAQAELDIRAAREVTLRGVAEGNTELTPGAIIDVSGVAYSLNGRYVLTEVNHIVDNRVGYITELNTTPPKLAERSRAAIYTYGVVTDILDPENKGRLRVRLPTFSDLVTDWIGVLTIGAGDDKGFLFVPDINDEVIVLLSQENPAQGVIIGGVYGMNGMPDNGIENGAVRRFTLLTPGGQRIRLDDNQQTIRIENNDGSFIEMSPSKVHLHSSRDLEIEAPGKGIIIRGSTIDFERG
jgi:phage protein D/phage baseplate assembly protein gpV